MICPWVGTKTFLFNFLTYKAFLEFFNDGLSNPTIVFCEGFLLIQPHLFTLLFLLAGLGSITPSTRLFGATNCDPKKLGFCDTYTSDEKWEGKRKGVRGGLERYRFKYSYDEGAEKDNLDTPCCEGSLDKSMGF